MQHITTRIPEHNDVLVYRGDDYMRLDQIFSHDIYQNNETCEHWFVNDTHMWRLTFDIALSKWVSFEVGMRDYPGAWLIMDIQDKQPRVFCRALNAERTDILEVCLLAVNDPRGPHVRKFRRVV